VGHFVGVGALKKALWLHGGYDVLAKGAELALVFLAEAARQGEELIDVDHRGEVVCGGQRGGFSG